MSPNPPKSREGTEMYRHTQIGWVTIISIGLGMLLVGYHGDIRSKWIVLSVLGILVICIILFASLTVTGDNSFIRIKFGPGLIRKSFPLEEIESCTVVRNRWWYGWGIRITPHGWMFNVHGLDAVQLMRKNGKRSRIGTDEPQKLVEAINRWIGK